LLGLFLNPPQLDPLRPPHFAESAHRSRDTVGKRAERANKSRTLRVRRLLHSHGPSGLAQPVLHLHGRCGYESRSRLRWLCRTRRSDRFTPGRYPACCRTSSPASCCAHSFSLNARRARLTFLLRLPLPEQPLTACVVPQSAYLTAGCGASWHPVWGTPTVSEGDCP
jgi:hypothetical protein